MDAITRNKTSLTLPSDLEFQITRAFEAPASLVFRVWTEAEHIQRWYGCDQAKLTRCDVDLAVNGGYRYAMEYNGGSGTMFGVYREIEAPRRLVYTQGYVADNLLTPNGLVTMTFTETNGRTTLTITTRHASKADRDAHLASGVEQGAVQCMDRLEVHLRTIG